MVGKTKSKTDATDLVEPSTITRLLVVSFFIALSLGLISGVDIKLLATPFLPETIAEYTMRGLMLVLSILVLVGVFRRPAALILALMVFWPSYMTLFSGGDVSAFWRDLALIGGLIMSAAEGRKTVVETADAETENHIQPAANVTLASAPQPKTTDDGAYREDFNLVHSG